MQEEINRLNKLLEGKSTLEQFKIVAEEFSGNIRFSTSLGEEDQVITDLICANNLPVDIFTLDTGRMFYETYKLLNRTREKYQQEIKVYFPESEDIEKLMTEKGAYSFYDSIENRKECCQLRKVKPLRRALAGAKCWITGLRASQSQNRSDFSVLEWDEGFQVIKYNPLIDWSLEDVKKHIKDNFVPYNSLHDQGFVSIGCQPCTRAIQPGEDIRAGRWWWEDTSKKECGLHARGGNV